MTKTTMKLSVYSYAIGLRENAKKETEVDSEEEAAEYIENRIRDIEDNDRNNEPDMFFFVKDENDNDVNVF